MNGIIECCLLVIAIGFTAVIACVAVATVKFIWSEFFRMKDAFLLGGILIVVAIAIMGIGVIGDYAMRHQSEIAKRCECK